MYSANLLHALITRHGKWSLAAALMTAAMACQADIEATRKRFHEGDGVNLYGVVVDGLVLGQGTK